MQHSVRRLVTASMVIGWLAVAGMNSHAEPVAYRSVSSGEDLTVMGSDHNDVEILGSFPTTIDLAAGDSSAGQVELVLNSRVLRLDDPSPGGFSVLNTSTTVAGPCSSPPCSIPVSTQGRLVTTNPGAFGAARGVLAPNDEFIASVVADGFETAGLINGQVSANVLVRTPATLSVADLAGSYSLFAFSTILAVDFDETSEMHVIDELEITFGGDGLCSGGSLGLIETLFVTEWPDLASRETVLATQENSYTATSCSYSVDSAEGTVTVTLGVLDEGQPETIEVALYVSSQARYLAGSIAFSDVDGSETAHEQNLLVGVRTETAPSNTNITGVYLLSIIGEEFRGGFNGGTEANYAARYAIEFSGSAPGGDGYSACTVIGSTLAGSTQTLTGVMTNAQSGSAAYGSPSSQFSQCRYRSQPGGAVEFEFSNNGSDWERAQLRLSDDGATLVGGAVTTSAASLAPDTPTPVSFSKAWLVLAQRADSTASAPEVAEFLRPFIPDADPAIALAAAVLPNSRSVTVGTPATAFATIINGGTVDALRCKVDLVGANGIDFSFQRTDPATNTAIGTVNELVDIAAGSSQSFIFTVTAEQFLSATELELVFNCANSNSATSIVGINTLLFSASTVAVPDVIALVATATNDGIVHLDPANGQGAFSVASINVGADSDIEVSVDTGDATLPVTLSLCQTDPATAQCINPTAPTSSPVSVNVPTNGTPTFSVFAAGSERIDLNAATRRVFIRVRDTGGNVRGAASVAIVTD